MTAQILDGKLIAERVRSEVQARAEAFAARTGRMAALALVLVGDDPASHSYVASKEKQSNALGLRGVAHRLPGDITQAQLLAVVQRLNADDTVDGVLVQLPLPASIDEKGVLDAIDPQKDVDGLHPINAGLLVSGGRGLRPCTPVGIMRLLAETGISLAGKRALVIGRSALVGKPVALLLLEQNCTVTIAHSQTGELEERVAESDIVVAAAGVPELVKGAWIKPGALVIDVGNNRLADKKVVGDVEFAAARERAAWITPVPGGVGPMTVAMLLSNTIEAAELRLARTPRA